MKNEIEEDKKVLRFIHLKKRRKGEEKVEKRNCGG